MEGRNNSRIPHSYPSGGLIGNLRSRIVSFLVSGYGVHQLTYLQHHLFLLSMCWRTSVLKCRSEKFPARDIWFLHTVPQGSYQMGRVVGTPSPPPSVGFTGGLSPPGPPCSSSKGACRQNVRAHTRMLGLSVFPDSNIDGLARRRVFRMLGPIPE